MGIFNKAKKEVQRQFIARPDESKDQNIYIWPVRNIRLMTQLTVQPDEICLFVKKGEVVGTLESGTHKLDGASIPFISLLIDAATSGNFLMAELYFVSTRSFTDLPFGGMIDNVLDPTTNLAVGIRLFGEYSLEVTNPEALILKIVGTKDMQNNSELTDWIKDLLLKVFRESVTEYVTEEKKPILGIASQVSEFEDKVLERVKDEVSEYGIKINKLGNVTISIKEDDEKTLKQMTRDFAYAKNMDAADAAVKLGMAEGLKKGGNAAASSAQAAAGVATGMGIAAGMNATKNSANSSERDDSSDKIDSEEEK